MKLYHLKVLPVLWLVTTLAMAGCQTQSPTEPSGAAEQDASLAGVSSGGHILLPGKTSNGPQSAGESIEPTEFYGCYVPSTGAVYRIREPGLPSDCTGPRAGPQRHVLFSWTDGAGALREGTESGGDLSGYLPYPMVTGLRGVALSNQTPETGHVLTYDGQRWSPQEPVAEEGSIEGADVSGDLSGTLPSPVVTGLRTVPLASQEPNVGEVLVYDGQHWKPSPAGGDLSGLFSSLSLTRIRGIPLSDQVPTEGQVLTFDGQQWIPQSSVTGEGSIEGTDVGGDLYGTLPNPGVGALRGVPLAEEELAAGDILTYSGSRWLPVKPKGDIGGSFYTGLILQQMRAIPFGNSVNPNTAEPGYVLTYSGSAWELKLPPGELPYPVSTQATPNTIAVRNNSGGLHATNLVAVGGDIRASGGSIYARDGMTSPGGFSTGKVTIGETGHIHSSGTTGSGDYPFTSLPTNNVMLWWPARGVFRTGGGATYIWQESDMGLLSTGFGMSRARGDYATAMGWGTYADGYGSVAAGINASALGSGSIAMGENVGAQQDHSVAIGYNASARNVGAVAIGSSRADAPHSIAIGHNALVNIETADRAMVLGSNVATIHRGVIAIGDGSDNPVTALTNKENQFAVRAAGGVRIFTDSQLGSGAFLEAGSGSWSSLSDAAAKFNFAEIDVENILIRLAAMPITTWSYISQGSGVVHMGPTAQDFYRTFGFGESDVAISSVDADGVALVAIQALEQRTRDLQNDNDALKVGLEALTIRLQQLEEKLQQWEQAAGGDR